jgi:phospholipid-binding lipoprotein MlaA
MKKRANNSAIPADFAVFGIKNALQRLRAALLMALAASLLVLGGCATTTPRGFDNPAPAKDNPLLMLPVLSLVDPFEPFNRKVAAFNDSLDQAVLKPAAQGYQKYVPALVRTGVSNFFSNYRDLWSGVNAFLQAEPAAGFDNLLRFGVNTTFGFAGILDIAGEAGIERHKKDLGQTLARWGVKSGPYVVLPLFGPTTLRDGLTFTVDQQAEVIRTFDKGIDRLPLHALQAVDKRANLLSASAAVDDAALDKYTFTRDVFLQLRNNEIWDGNPPEADKEKDKDK